MSRFTPRCVTLHPLPSAMGRQLLVAELLINDAVTHVGVVHLESRRPMATVRAQQLAQIFQVLEAADRVILMGDFNFCSSWTLENRRIDPAYEDMWHMLRSNELGYTEDTKVNLMRWDQTGKTKRARFDRVLCRFSRPGWVPTAIDLMGTECIDLGQPRIFASDHFGLRSEFTWS